MSVLPWAELAAVAAAIGFAVYEMAMWARDIWGKHR